MAAAIERAGGPLPDLGAAGLSPPRLGRTVVCLVL
jgi:hypothetical protein